MTHIIYVKEKPRQTCFCCGKRVIPKKADDPPKEPDGYLFLCPECGCKLGYGGRIKEGYVKTKPQQICFHCKKVVIPKCSEECFTEDQGYMFVCPECGKTLGPGGKLKNRKGISARSELDPESYCREKPRQQCPCCGILVSPMINLNTFRVGKGYVFSCPVCGEVFGYGGTIKEEGKRFEFPYAMTLAPQVCPSCGKHIIPLCDKGKFLKTDGYMFRCPNCRSKIGYGGFTSCMGEDGERKKSTKFSTYKLGIDYCQLCGVRREELEIGQLECHHLVPIRDGGLDIRVNIIVVCSTCHRMIHIRRKARQRGEQCDFAPDTLPG